MKVRISDLNARPKKYSSSTGVIKTFVMFSLIINTISALTHDESTDNFLSEKANNEIKPIYDPFCRGASVYDEESITVITASQTNLLRNKQDGVEPSLKYLQMLKTVLSDSEHVKEDMIELLRKYYTNNQSMLKMVNEFEEDYDKHSPIWWYTRECFLSPIINQALRTMDMKVLIKMGLFLRDICEQIKDFYTEAMSLEPFTVYRCLELKTSDFDKLQQNKDGYISFNSFLLTSTEPEFAKRICSNVEQNTGTLPILFQIYIEPATSPFTLFASLNQLSYDANVNNHVLFCLSSVFRISNMIKTDRNIWQVELTGKNADYNSIMEFLTELLNLGMSNEKGWNQLGQMMISMKELKRAEELYKVILESVDKSNETEIALLYEKLGIIKLENGSYDEAYFFFGKELEIQKKLLSSNHPELASLYNILGVSNSKMGKLQNALSYYQKALEILEEIFPSNHPNLATIYDNIGLLNTRLGNYSVALSYHQKALQINEKVLPLNHPDLAINYNNMGELYKLTENYSIALSFYLKAIQINELILSADDPNLAATYDNIGVVYQHMNLFDKALLFYEKTLQINEKVLHSNHPELSVTYTNIGDTMFHMGNFSDAMWFYQRALEIQKASLHPDHLFIAHSYNRIGNVYKSMEEFSNALSFYEKALQIQKISLPPDHSGFIVTYINLGELYYMIGKYSTSRSYFEQGLKIGELSLPENHSEMMRLRHYIALLEKEL